MKFDISSKELNKEKKLDLLSKLVEKSKKKTEEKVIE